MPAQQPLSLQDILVQRQEEEFVGRSAPIRQFMDNLHLPLEDPRRRFVFDVYGPAGVGKTWLLQRLRRLVEEGGALTAWTDEAQQDVPAVMGIFAAQLAEAGVSLKNFQERYRVYRQKRNELEADPEAPTGLPVFLGQVLARAGMHLVKQVPVAGFLLDLMDDDVVATQVGEWTAYITRKLTNKDEVQLMLAPLDVLTPLFLKDLHKAVKKRPLVLFFDAYEHTGSFLDPWLRSLLEGRYGEVPAQIIFVIAGRDALDKSAWAPFERLLARVPLAEFTDEELRQYLERKGVTDEAVIEAIKRLSGNIPLLVAMLAAEHPEDLADVDEPSDTAIEHFLKWISDSGQRQLAVNAALPRRLNRDVLRVLVPDASEDLFLWLIHQPFVQETAYGWVYHDLVRAQMLRHKRRQSPQDWARIHKALAEYYDDLMEKLKLSEKTRWQNVAWQEYALERTYHRLAGNARAYMMDAVNEFMGALDVDVSLATRWAETIRQAGEDSDQRSVRVWGKLLLTALTGEGDARHAAAVEAFTRMLKSPKFSRRWRPYAYMHRGMALAALHQHAKAIDDLTHAVKMAPRDVRPLLRRGEVLVHAGRYRKAAADFDAVLARDRRNLQALYWRGITAVQLGHDKQALKYFDRLLKLQPEHARAHAQRAGVLFRLGRVDEALAELDEALALQPDDAQVRAQRGDVFLQMGRLREAIGEFNLALNLNPQDPWSLARRGEAYRLLGYYSAALSDLSRALELQPDNAWALASRGELYRMMGEYEKALVDLDRALELDPRDLWARATRGVTLLHLGRLQEAISDLTQALEKQPKNAWALAYRAEAYRRLRQFNKAIIDVTKAIRLQPEEDWYYYGRALVYLSYSRRKMKKARDDLHRAIALAEHRLQENPEDWVTMLNLALYHLALGEEERAEALYKQALRSGATEYHVRAALDDVRTLTATIADLLDMEAVERMEREREL